MSHSLQNLTRTLLAAFMVLAMSVTSLPALAQQARGITLQDAERIALQHFPGATVESVERDVKQGVAVYEVELRDDRGVEHEMVIDAADGRVIRTHVDD